MTICFNFLTLIFLLPWSTGIRWGPQSLKTLPRGQNGLVSPLCVVYTQPIYTHKHLSQSLPSIFYQIVHGGDKRNMMRQTISSSMTFTGAMSADFVKNVAEIG